MLRDVLKRRERGESCVPVTMATIPELRMTRRLVGETDVCARDDHRRCERSVGMFSDWTKRGPVYELPFGALYHPSVPNLLTAGRCLSAADDLWNVTRVIPVWRRLRRGCRNRRGAGLRLPCSGHCRLAGNAPRAGRARASRRAVISVQIKGPEISRSQFLFQSLELSLDLFIYNGMHDRNNFQILFLHI